MPDATTTISQPVGWKPSVRGLLWPLRRIYANLRISRAMVMSAFNFHFRRGSRRHTLPQPLIVSLTSYPPRFATLTLTLQCLLGQSVRPDRTILWVGPEDHASLPPAILKLRQHGLEIRTTRDVGPFTKIIPALYEFPQAIIVTADDDVYYWHTWLAELTTAWSGANNEIVCHRANGISQDVGGRPRPYAHWPMGVPIKGKARGILPTGVQGVMYPPGSLSPRVLDADTFTKLCPRADDIWLYWMGRLAGSEFRVTGRGRRPCMWRNSQAVALYKTNVLQDGNDPQIAAMIENFGWPPGNSVQGNRQS